MAVHGLRLLPTREAMVISHVWHLGISHKHPCYVSMACLGGLSSKPRAQACSVVRMLMLL